MERTSKLMPPPLGGVEPHAPLLQVPSDDQSLYKIMSVENLLRSVAGGYLHFARVDAYADFPKADAADGAQLLKDRESNAAASFAAAPAFSAADYYDQARARTYAYCLSLENSSYIWEHYSKGSERGQVGLEFNFAQLRTHLNQTLKPGASALVSNGVRCHQIFTVNYGIVEYVDWESYHANEMQLPNPISYTYLKDKQKYSQEREFRISLSAFGIGEFRLNDGTQMDFPAALQVDFDFRRALAEGCIRQFLVVPTSDSDFLKAELRKLRIEPATGAIS